MYKNNIFQQRVSQLRKIMLSSNIDCFLVTHDDERLTEYTPENFKRLKWLIGFTGSAGYLIVTIKNLYLFVDGRYTLQSKNETKGLKITLYDISKFDLLSFFKLFQNKLKNIALDLKSITTSQHLKYKEESKKAGWKVVDLKNNLIDLIWKRDLKVQDTNSIFLLSSKYTGAKYEKKISLIFSFLKENKSDMLFLQNSESLAWLLNIRGKDFDCTPILYCFSLFTINKVYIFLENKNIPLEVKNQFSKKIVFLSYDDINKVLKQRKIKSSKTLLDPKTTSKFYYNLLSKTSKSIKFIEDPVQNYKSIKNSTEIKNIKKAHLLDGIAICKFLYWVKNKKESITELDVVKKIDFLRSINSEYLSRSFPTIAGSGANGAIIHYIPNANTNKKISKNDILLLDSGGQYNLGTTDVTRTIAFGKVTQEQSKNYTLVLKGHIAVSMAIFPEGKSGRYLDNLARSFLWADGKDFAHGTGHGVGYCLNVHEGPFSISDRNNIPLKKGMVFSNEPGFYKENSYGIRIENLVVADQIKFGTKSFIKINTLTLAPYETSLIKKNMLTKDEITWLKSYNKNLFKSISPYLLEKEKNWLYHYSVKIL
jgi:Xaa-Pro aminopeptidase